MISPHVASRDAMRPVASGWQAEYHTFFPRVSSGGPEPSALCIWQISGIPIPSVRHLRLTNQHQSFFEPIAPDGRWPNG